MHTPTKSSSVTPEYLVAPRSIIPDLIPTIVSLRRRLTLLMKVHNLRLHIHTLSSPVTFENLIDFLVNCLNLLYPDISRSLSRLLNTS